MSISLVLSDQIERRQRAHDQALELNTDVLREHAAHIGAILGDTFPVYLSEHDEQDFFPKRVLHEIGSEQILQRNRLQHRAAPDSMLHVRVAGDRYLSSMIDEDDITRAALASLRVRRGYQLRQMVGTRSGAAIGGGVTIAGVDTLGAQTGIIDKVGYGIFALGLSALAWAYNSEPAYRPPTDIRKFAPPIGVTKTS